jgi:hypothetical protein
MSRKTTLWKQKIIQAQGNFDKLVPAHATGTGMYLTKHEIQERMYSPQEGGSKKVCTVPMKTEKEQRLRALATKMYR